MVGVEEVLADLGDGVVGLDVARLELVERGRGVDAGPGEAGRPAEVADQQPLAGAGDYSSADSNRK